MDDLQISQAIVGGASMGAAIALNFVLRYPKRVLGLVAFAPGLVGRAQPVEREDVHASEPVAFAIMVLSRASRSSK